MQQVVQSDNTTFRHSVYQAYNAVDPYDAVCFANRTCLRPEQVYRRGWKQNGLYQAIKVPCDIYLPAKSMTDQPAYKRGDYFIAPLSNHTNWLHLTEEMFLDAYAKPEKEEIQEFAWPVQVNTPGISIKYHQEVCAKHALEVSDLRLIIELHKEEISEIKAEDEAFKKENKRLHEQVQEFRRALRQTISERDTERNQVRKLLQELEAVKGACAYEMKKRQANLDVIKQERGEKEYIERKYNELVRVAREAVNAHAVLVKELETL